MEAVTLSCCQVPWQVMSRGRDGEAMGKKKADF